MNLLFDIQYAARNLAKSWGFTLLTVCVMAIGLGASIFITTVVKSLAWEPMYFPDGDAVVEIRRRVNDEWRSTLLHDYQKVKDEAKTVDLISSYKTDTAVITDGFRSIRYRGTAVSGDFFKITGVTPLLGRVLNEEDQVPGSLPVVLLSYRIWQNLFGGRQNIVGEKVLINGKPHEVVGVVTEGSAHPLENTVWLPLKLNANDIPLKKSRSINGFYARIKEGTTLEEVRQEINTIFANSPDLTTDSDQKLTARIYPVKRASIRALVNVLYIMLSAAICVLFLCCINVGNLLLARSNGRMKETAIRLALGAPRKKLISQTMWEAVFICLLGGTFAILLAGWGVDSTMSYFNNRFQLWEFPKFAEINYGFDDISIGIAITLVTIFLTGFVPAWQASKCEFNEILKDGSKTSLGRKSGWISKLLVGMQISFSSTLMIAAGVLFILIQQGIASGYGVAIDQFLSGRVNPLREFYPKGEAVEAYFDRILAEAKVIPGVEQATLISHVPTEYPPARNIEPEGGNWRYTDYVRVREITVYSNAFDVFGIPLLEGRFFDQRDTENKPDVVIVSELLASKLWPNESPIGKRLRGYRDKRDKPSKWKTVVGVVPQIKQNELFEEELTPSMYVPYAQKMPDAMAIVLKTHKDPASLKEPLANAVLKIDPNTPVYRSVPLKLQDENNRAFPDFIKRVFAIFALAALVMAATGIFGMMANHIKRRTQEIGIRRALGILDSAIVKLILKQSAYQLAGGFLFGVPLGYVISILFVSRFSSGGLLYISVYFIVPLIISIVVLFATIAPLLNVLRQPPSSALRYE